MAEIVASKDFNEFPDAILSRGIVFISTFGLYAIMFYSVFCCIICVI